MEAHNKILVCGTGIAGLACALGLAKAGLPVAILGPRVVPKNLDANHYHPRVYAISAASRQLLEQLGAWDLMAAERITAVEAMEIYGDADGSLDLSAWQDARTSMAWIVESGALERALQQVVKVLGIEWHQAHFKGLQASATGVRVLTDTAEELTAALLVGADGARSPVRQAAGIQHDYRPYGDQGVVAHLDSELPHQNRAYQWFTGDSVFALLPMPDTDQGAQLSLVWSMRNGQARHWLAMDPEERQQWFGAMAQAITGGRLGCLRLRTQPLGFPLSLEYSAMVAPAVALVGDAAHRVHPLAGQGLNLGLGDVKTLVQVLKDKEPQRLPGDLRVLARYRRRRKEAMYTMGMLTDGLHRLFAAEPAALAWGRNLGMRLLDSMPLIKRQLIRAAAGD